MAKSPTKAKSKAKAKAAKPKAAPASTDKPRQPGVERRRNHPTRAKNGVMEVLLTNKVEHLGGPGELVKVKPGFARNYLLPQGLATFATPHNLRIVDKHRERLRALEEAKKADLVNLAAQIGQKTIIIQANANPEGHLYGSVNAAQIAESLAAEGVPVTEEMVQLEGALRETGLYTITLNLGQEVAAEFKLWVVPTHAEEEATE